MYHACDLAAGSPWRHLEQLQLSRSCHFATAWPASNNYSFALFPFPHPDTRVQFFIIN